MTSNTETPGLLTCPFCGGDAERQESINISGSGRFWVTCTCGVNSPTRREPDDAEIAWNTRTPPNAEPTTDPELLRLLEAAVGHEMSKEEIDAQRESWVRGQVGPSTSVVVSPPTAEPTDGAPVTIWAWTDKEYDANLWNNHGDARYTPAIAIPYTRKDLSDARIAELEAALTEIASLAHTEGLLWWQKIARRTLKSEMGEG